MTAFLSSFHWSLAAIFLAGLCLGRFLNLCILRFPRDERLSGQLRLLLDRPRACDGCGRLRPWYQCLPLLGAVRAFSRCPHCRRALPRRFAVVELLTAALLAALFYQEVISQPGTISANHYLHFAYYAVLICGLIVATFIDIDLKIIPDGSTLPAMAVGLLGALILQDAYLAPLWRQDPFPGFFYELAPRRWDSLAHSSREPAWFAQWPHWHGLAVSVAGIIVGGGIVWAVRIAGRQVLRKEAMGFGDVILLAMIGSFLGWQATVIIFFLAPFFALVTVVISWIFLRNREIPFGPYLSLAAVMVLFGWDAIWARTEHIFGLGVYLPLLAAVMFVAFVSLLLMWRGIQRLFGIEPEQEWTEEWTPGDQLAYLAGEVSDPDQGQWKRETWPGISAGQGRLHSRRWRAGN